MYGLIIRVGRSLRADTIPIAGISVLIGGASILGRGRRSLRIWRAVKAMNEASFGRVFVIHPQERAEGDGVTRHLSVSAKGVVTNICDFGNANLVPISHYRAGIYGDYSPELPPSCRVLRKFVSRNFGFVKSKKDTSGY